MHAAMVIAFSGFGPDVEFRTLAHNVLIEFCSRLSAIRKWKIHLRKQESGLYLEAIAVPHASQSPLKFRTEALTLAALENQLDVFFGRRFGCA
jgi:hypothetical protein